MTVSGGGTEQTAAPESLGGKLFGVGAGGPELLQQDGNSHAGVTGGRNAPAIPIRQHEMRGSADGFHEIPYANSNARPENESNRCRFGGNEHLTGMNEVRIGERRILSAGGHQLREIG